MKNKDLKTIIKIYFLIEHTEFNRYCNHALHRLLLSNQLENKLCSWGCSACPMTPEGTGCYAKQVPSGQLSLSGGPIPSPSPNTRCIKFCLQMKCPQTIQTADCDVSVH